ncbi:MAG: hypothetical protein Q7J05_00830 [Paludibacter sp.]|nr:hypothetical protein [Paludibacter sp.]
MQKSKVNISFSYRFRRWSRKAYAVFASLNKAISIGSLSVDMASATLFRSMQQINRFLFQETEEEQGEEAELLALLNENIVLVNFTNEPSKAYPATGLLTLIYY